MGWADDPNAALTVSEVGLMFVSCDFLPVPLVDAPLSMIVLCSRFWRDIRDAVGALTRNRLSVLSSGCLGMLELDELERDFLTRVIVGERSGETGEDSSAGGT